MAEIAVGIDFGATSSCVGVWRNNDVEIIANDQGNRTSPSMLGFNDQEQLAGEAAKSQQESNASNTVYDIKCMLGKKFSDPEIQAKAAKWPFKVVAGSDDQLLVEVTLCGKKEQLTAEDLASLVLKDMVKLAGSYLGKAVSHAVITVPADFSEAQKSALKNAAAKIKLNVLRLISEPTAAAISCGFDDVKTNGAGKKNVAVLDVGGGSSDAAVLCVQDGLISLKSTVSKKVGGKDYTDKLVDHFLALFEKKKGVKIEGKDSDRALAKLRYVCARAKMSLAANPQAAVEVDPLFAGKEMYESISRARFEAMTGSLSKDAVSPLKDALKEAGLTAADIDEIVLVGGCTRMPKIKTLVSQLMPNVSVVEDVNPNEASAFGASIQASLLIDFVKDQKFNTYPTVDVSSLTLGLGLAGGVSYPLIPRGSPLPCSRTITTSTAADDQETVMLQVVQGESLGTTNEANELVAKFVLSGLTKGPRGTPKVEVTFAVDAAGALTVSAVEKTSGKSQQLNIECSKEAVDCRKRVEAAKKSEASDKDLMTRLTALSTLRTHTECVLKQIKDKTLADESGKIATAAAGVVAWLAEADKKDLFVPALAAILLKRTELDAAAVEDEEESEEEDDEGDSSEEEESSDEEEDLD